jgi:hypothetical protein
MKTCRLLLTITGAALSVFLSLPSYALPVMDISAENLVWLSKDIQKSLDLQPNQRLLWQQVQDRVSGILQARQSRRALLQREMMRDLDDPKVELREAAKKIEAEEELSHQENKQLRELFLAMDDAMKDSQRLIIRSLLADQLQRSDERKLESG